MFDSRTALLVKDVNTEEKQAVPVEQCDKCSKNVEPKRQGRALLGKINSN